MDVRSIPSRQSKSTEFYSFKNDIIWHTQNSYKNVPVCQNKIFFPSYLCLLLSSNNSFVTKLYNALPEYTGSNTIPVDNAKFDIKFNSLDGYC